MLPTRDPPQNKRPTQTESEGLETSKFTGKKTRVAILIPDKINFKERAIKRDPEGHFLTLKVRIHQEDINCKHICTQHKTKIYMENLGGFQENIESNRLILGDFNTLVSTTD